MATNGVSASNQDDDIAVSTLADPNRRRVLRTLRDAGSRLSLADLATEIARRESDSETDDVPWEQASNYHVMLYHCHLPKLEAAGLVDFDADQKMVAPVETPERELEV